MLELAVWLKHNGYRADQVQAFLPGPMATATAMYHSGVNPLRKVTRESEPVYVPKGAKQRRLHKAFLRYHDADNWPILREALLRMGREDLIGNSKKHLVPTYQPREPAEKTTNRFGPSMFGVSLNVRLQEIEIMRILIATVAIAIASTAAADIKRTPSGKPDLSGFYDSGSLTPLNRPTVWR